MAKAVAANPYVGVTAGDAVRLMTRVLTAAGFEDGAVDARILVPDALGLTKQDVLLAPERALSMDEAHRAQVFEARRLAHEPVSRILGQREFYGRMFAVTPATLDPRPDSETLIEAALEIAGQRGWLNAPIRILDIGTGTGCLLLTLLAELPSASGIGTDLQDAALNAALANAAFLQLETRTDWLLARSMEGVSGHFDLVISNPPYIPTGDLSKLDPDVRLYDPPVALDGGVDGLAVYREIIAGLGTDVTFQAAVFEVGAGQASAVEMLLRSRFDTTSGHTRTWQDLGGHTRCVAFLTH